MDPQQQRLEVQAIGPRDDDLAVEHAALGEPLPEWPGHLREVPVERLEVAALEQHLVTVAEADGPKAIPLGLEQPAISLGQAIRWLGQHGLQGRRHGQAHGLTIPVRGSPASRLPRW